VTRTLSNETGGVFLETRETYVPCSAYTEGSTYVLPDTQALIAAKVRRTALFYHHISDASRLPHRKPNLAESASNAIGSRRPKKQEKSPAQSRRIV
jgi:hypothetical protein